MIVCVKTSDSKACLTSLVLLLLTAQFVAWAALGVIHVNAQESITSEAEAAIASAYESILVTENAGANVTALVTQLNKATTLINGARMAERLGNYASAASLADSAKSIALEVRGEAVSLKKAVSTENLQQRLITMITTALGVSFIAVGSFLMWSFLTKRANAPAHVKN